MPRISLLLASTAVALAWGNATLAQSTAPSAYFDRLDADRDGTITRTEFDAHRAGQFKAADRNGDGLIDKAEFAAYAEVQRGEAVARLFARYDRDGDGRIAAADLPRPRLGPQRRLSFDRIDTARAGSLALDEYRKALGARLEARLEQRFKAVPDRRLGYEEFARRPRESFLLRIEAEFKAMDANGDGKLTRAEHEAAAAKPRLLLFADFDRDGFISKAELSRSFAARGGVNERAFDALDGDKDGKASAGEWNAAGSRLFGRLDRNKDGLIAAAEMTPSRRRD